MQLLSLESAVFNFPGFSCSVIDKLTSIVHDAILGALMVEPPSGRNRHYERQPEQIADREAKMHENLGGVCSIVFSEAFLPLLLIFAVPAAYEYQEQHDGCKRQSDDR
jgi:hypothetical protein